MTSKRSLHEPTQESQPGRRYVYYVVVLLTVVNVFSQMDRMALSALLPFIKRDLGLSDTGIGLLVGLGFSLFHALCGIPIARLADRGIRKNIVAASLVAWSVMTALSGAAQNFWHLLMARIGVGVGEAGCLPPSHSMICDYVRPQSRAGVFAIYAVGTYVGIMIGMSLAGWLGQAVGWRWTFVALGVPGIALSIIVGCTLREPKRGAFDAAGSSDEEHPPIIALLGTLWRQRPYRWTVVFLTANGFVHSGLLQWWPSLYQRSYRLDMSEAGVYLGAAIGIGSATGLLTGGLIANRLRKIDIELPLVVGAVAILFATLTKIGSLTVDSVAVSIAFVFVSGLLWCIPNGAVVAALHEAVAPRMRASAIAIATLLMAVVGGGLGPLGVGLLSDFLSASAGEDGLRYALLILVCLSPLVALTLYLAARQFGNARMAIDPRGDIHL